ncbi:MAG TPA: helix-hairpin-helix domain-containing protein [Nitrospirales bacterium]|nr:helix-hairpin-helix domain-containing protein [Nitrospirales bacterium]
MNDVKPRGLRAGSLQWPDMHSGEFSCRVSLLLKLAFLGAGVCFVYWVGWPQLALSPGVPLENSGVLESRTFLSGSADHPAEVVNVATHSGRDVVYPPQVMVKGEPGPTREIAGVTVDLNDGTLAELEHLPGIGPVLAGRIMAHRTSHGAFRHIEDLVLVPGIGEKRLELLRPFVGVGPSTKAIGIGS